MTMHALQESHHRAASKKVLYQPSAFSWLRVVLLRHSIKIGVAVRHGRGGMSNGVRDLVTSMIRIYGKAEAFYLADRYAIHHHTNGDTSAHARWIDVAALICEQIELDRRFGKQPT